MINPYYFLVFKYVVVIVRYVESCCSEIYDKQMEQTFIGFLNTMFEINI